MTRALAPFVLLAACASPPPPPTVPGPLVLSSGGFDVGGTDLEIGFGRAERGAIAAATKLIGRPPVERVQVGSCHRAVWSDGLTMHFRGGAFVGWTDAQARSGATQAGAPC